MKDLEAKLAKLLDDANDCDIIGNLATDPRKRASFRRMAQEFRAMADRLRADIAVHKDSHGAAGVSTLTK